MNFVQHKERLYWIVNAIANNGGFTDKEKTSIILLYNPLFNDYKSTKSHWKVKAHSLFYAELGIPFSKIKLENGLLKNVHASFVRHIKNVGYIWLLSDICLTCSCILTRNLNPYGNPVELKSFHISKYWFSI